MKIEIKELLNRQARWQKGRAKLSWCEKLQHSIALREATIALRKHYVPHGQVTSVAENCIPYKDGKEG